MEKKEKALEKSTFRLYSIEKELELKEMRKKFTLIELLVVIGLASLLMSIMLPAFNRMISGNAVDRAASELKLALEHAQSIAASSRKYTAIILPSGSTTVWTKSAEQKARLGGYRFCFVADYTDTTKPAIFQRWTPESEWKTPADGARLLRVSLTKPADSSQTGEIFKLQDGTSLLPDTLSLLTSGESGESSLPEKSLKQVNQYEGGAARDNCAIIFSPYGEMKNTEDAYLTVGETQISSGNLIFPGGSNAGPVNTKTLHINRITGAVEYYKKL